MTSMQTAIPRFSDARVLVAGDGEAKRFDDALNGIVSFAKRLAACGQAAHGAR